MISNSNWLADVVLAIHTLFILFVVGGQLFILIGWWRKWQWTRHFIFRLLHLAAIAFVVLESWIGMVCPLTWLEAQLRDEASHEFGFISQWLHRWLFYSFPEWVFILIYTIFGLLVAFTFYFYPPRKNLG